MKQGHTHGSLCTACSVWQRIVKLEISEDDAYLALTNAGFLATSSMAFKPTGSHL